MPLELVQEKRKWFEVDRYGNRSYSHTEDNGAFCKFVAGISQAYGWSCLVACFACYCLSWLFLALTFIFLYEEIDLTAEVEYFVLINDKKYPLEMNLYPKMDRKVAKVGAVKRSDIIRGRKVYTGWVKLETEGEFWLYCNRRGKMIFARFPTEEEAHFFCQQQIAAATTEVEGVPMVNNAPTQPGDYRCVVPIETKADIEAPHVVVLDSHVMVVDPAESA